MQIIQELCLNFGMVLNIWPQNKSMSPSLDKLVPMTFLNLDVHEGLAEDILLGAVSRPGLAGFAGLGLKIG